MNENTYTHQDLATLSEIARDVLIETGIIAIISFNPNHIIVEFSHRQGHIHDCNTLDEAISTLAGFISGFQLASKLN